MRGPNLIPGRYLWWTAWYWDKSSPSTSVFGTAVARWLRCCATNRKVAGSIPDGVSGFFIDIKSFRSHYGPGVDSGVFPGGKGGRCVRLTTYHHPVPLSRNLGTLTSLNPLGPSGPVTGLLYHFYLYFSFPLSISFRP